MTGEPMTGEPMLFGMPVIVRPLVPAGKILIANETFLGMGIAYMVFGAAALRSTDEWAQMLAQLYRPLSIAEIETAFHACHTSSLFSVEACFYRCCYDEQWLSDEQRARLAAYRSGAAVIAGITDGIAADRTLPAAHRTRSRRAARRAISRKAKRQRV